MSARSSRTRSRGRPIPKAGCCGARAARSPRAGSGSARSAARSSRRGGRGGGGRRCPRSVSWPVKRTWTSSVRSEPSASASAWPNSIPPSSIASSRLESGLRSLRWMVKLSGTRSSSSFSLRSRSSGTAVSTLGLRVRSSSPGAGRGRIGVVARLDIAAQLVVRGLQRLLALVVPLLDLVRGDDPLLDELLGVDLADRRVLLDLLRPSAAACRPARRSRCGRSGGSRSGR